MSKITRPSRLRVVAASAAVLLAATACSGADYPETADTVPAETAAPTTTTAVPVSTTTLPTHTQVPAPTTTSPSAPAAPVSVPAETEADEPTQPDEPSSVDPLDEPAPTTQPPVATTAPPHDHDDPPEPDHEHEPQPELVIKPHELLPAERGGTPPRPAELAGVAPPWRITPTVQAFADWCYGPLHDLHSDGGPDRLIRAMAAACADHIHSMMAPGHPRVAADPACIIAVTQARLVAYSDYAAGFEPAAAGLWVRDYALPADAAEVPNWADCRSALWPGERLVERDSPHAEDACTWAVAVTMGLDPAAVLSAEADENGVVTVLDWGPSSCLAEMWPASRGRCGFAFRMWSRLAHETGDLALNQTAIPGPC